MAEAHPVGFRWVMKARERGAKVIHVDPRYSRTSAMADLHVPIRAGIDIAFLGGLIRHVIETERYFKDYVRHYTNAATLVNEDFQDTEDLDGLFSRLRPGDRHLRPHARGCTRAARSPSAAGVREHATQAFEREDGRRDDDRRRCKRDETLQHPRCVFQIAQAPLRPLHAGDGRADLRHRRARTSSRSPTR